jgi:hypothetical protein
MGTQLRFTVRTPPLRHARPAAIKRESRMGEERKLYPDGFFRFHDSEGFEVVDGKSYYPAGLTVTVDQRQALMMLGQIANYLADERSKTMPIIFSFSGTIKRDEEEDDDD